MKKKLEGFAQFEELVSDVRGKTQLKMTLSKAGQGNCALVVDVGNSQISNRISS